MKKKKKRNLNFKIIIPLCVGVILIVLSLLMLYLQPKEKKKEKKKEENTLFLENFSVTRDDVYNDIGENETGQVSYGSYKIFHYKLDNKDIQDLLKKMNNNTKKQKEEDLKHPTANDPECSSVKDSYKYRYLTHAEIEYFEDTQNILSMSFEYTTYDYCKKTESFTSEVYNYSKKEKKFLTTEEFFEEFHYSEEDIHNIIQHFVKESLHQEIDVSQISNIRAFFNHESRLVLQYQLNGSEEWNYAFYIA